MCFDANRELSYFHIILHRHQRDRRREQTYDNNNNSNNNSFLNIC